MADRPLIHDAVLRVRINSALIQNAADKAQRESMSLSDLVRQAIRNEVGLGQ